MSCCNILSLFLLAQISVVVVVVNISKGVFEHEENIYTYMYVMKLRFYESNQMQIANTHTCSIYFEWTKRNQEIQPHMHARVHTIERPQ